HSVQGASAERAGGDELPRQDQQLSLPDGTHRVALSPETLSGGIIRSSVERVGSATQKGEGDDRSDRRDHRACWPHRGVIPSIARRPESLPGGPDPQPWRRGDRLLLVV